MENRTMLGLAAALATGFFALLSASPAFASISHGGITCTQGVGSGMNPYIYNCKPTGGGHVASGLSGTLADAQTKLIAAGALFWEFDTIANFNSFCNTTTVPALPCTTIPAGNAAWTSNHNSMIFDMGKSDSRPDTAAAHEAGHQLDLLYPTVGASVSKNATYVAKVAIDWTAFNLLTPCVSGGGGVFNGFLDSSANEFCSGLNGSGGSLSSTYTGTNEAVLQKGWAYFFKTGTANGCLTGQYCELWAEETAITFGDSDPGPPIASPDNFLKITNFECSKFLQSTLLRTGSLPAPTDYSLQCR